MRLIRWFPMAILTLAAMSACSKGTLFIDNDHEYGEDFPQVQKYPLKSPSIGMVGVYDANYQLFFGAGADVYELMYLEKDEEDEHETIERFIFKQSKPLDIVEIALQPVKAFNPLKDAECFIKITAKRVAQDQCDDAPVCKLFRLDNIYSADDDACGWPRMRDFILKLDSTGLVGSVAEPGVDRWTNIEKINVDGAVGSPVRIAIDDNLFSSVVATTTSEGYVFAGKLAKGDVVAAHFVKPEVPDSIQIKSLAEKNPWPFPGRASTRNVLLIITPEGFYMLNSQEKWEKLPFPAGMSAMPESAAVQKIESANGVGAAAIRFMMKESAGVGDVIVVFKEASAELFLLDMASLDLTDGLSSWSAWSLALINDSVWLWNSLAPSLARAYSEAEKKWQPVSLTIPSVDATESLPRYQLTSAGSGFVLSTTFNKEFTLVLNNGDGTEGQMDSDTIPFTKKIFRHFFYDAGQQVTENFLDTINPPEALHFAGNKAVIERVLGLGPFGSEIVLDYGYIYDFTNRKGQIFNDEYRPNEERLARFGSIIMRESTLLFFGGCDAPVNGICLSAPAQARLVDLAPKKSSL